MCASELVVSARPRPSSLSPTFIFAPSSSPLTTTQTDGFTSLHLSATTQTVFAPSLRRSEGVKSYLLRKDGTFEVYLGGYGDCNFAVAAGYTLHYRRKITGRLDVDGPTRAIRELKGVTVKLFVLWLPIGDVVVRGDAELSFYVGPLSATFPVSDFRECPRCRCGFHCAAAAAASPGSMAA